MTLRKTTSLTTLLSFILLLVTSIILYVTPQGKIAFWANWKILGLGKEQWGALHTNLGFLFIIAGLIHTLLNWKPIVAYMKNKARQLRVFTADLNLALAITLFITLFTLFELPPVNAVQTFGSKLKEDAATRYGEPPYGHAESSPLKSFCNRTGIDLAEALKKLEAAQLTSVSEQATLAEIAQVNHLSPQQVYDLIRPLPVSADTPKAMPESPGMGFGRKTFEAVCSEYGIDRERAIRQLEGLGIQATPDATMKSLAEQNGMDPHGLYEVLRQIQPGA